MHACMYVCVYVETIMTTMTTPSPTMKCVPHRIVSLYLFVHIRCIHTHMHVHAQASLAQAFLAHIAEIRWTTVRDKTCAYFGSLALSTRLKLHAPPTAAAMGCGMPYVAALEASGFAARSPRSGDTVLRVACIGRMTDLCAPAHTAKLQQDPLAPPREPPFVHRMSSSGGAGLCSQPMHLHQRPSCHGNGLLVEWGAPLWLLQCWV